MSRTAKHSTNHGPLAYGLPGCYKQRATGYEYWASRSGKRHGETANRFTKRRTHRRERRIGKRLPWIETA